jgi:drug/metabolite transporter (DMT)-like permease
MTVLFVLARIVASPVSNVLQKRLAQRSGSPLFIIGVVHALLTLVCLPLWLLFPMPARNPGWEVWTTMLLCAVLAVAGNVLLVYALKSTDLSVLGPINAYKSVVALVLGMLLLGEQPTAAGVAGMLLILAGSYFVVDPDVSHTRRNAFVRFFADRGIQLRFAALGLSATEAIFLKKAIGLSSPVTTFVLWCVLGLPVAAVALLILLKREMPAQVAVLRENSLTYLALALATGLMQLTTVLTFGMLQVGYSLALFQLSTLISVFLGYRYFQETNIRSRLFGSIVMVAGAVLIVEFGARR